MDRIIYKLFVFLSLSLDSELLIAEADDLCFHLNSKPAAK